MVMQCTYSSNDSKLQIEAEGLLIVLVDFFLAFSALFRLQKRKYDML